MVSFLEKNVCSDSGVSEFSVVFHRGGSDVYIDPADGAVFVFYTVNGLYRLENVFNRIHLRIFAGFDGKTLVTHILKGGNFLFYLLLCKLLSRNVLVFKMIRTVNASVHTVVGKIEGSEHYYAVSVEILFYLTGKIEYLAVHLFIFAHEKNRCLAVVKTFSLTCFFKYLPDKFSIVPVLFGVFDCFEYLFVRNKLFGLKGTWIVHF